MQLALFTLACVKFTVFKMTRDVVLFLSIFALIFSVGAKGEGTFLETTKF